MGPFFFLALVIIMLMQFKRDARIAARLSSRGLWGSPLVRACIVFLALVIVPPLLVAYSGIGGTVYIPDGGMLGVHALISLLISYTWYRYLTWLDPFEREKLGWELAVFFAACASTFLTFPLSDLVVELFSLRLDGDNWNDWWYSVIAIGLVEEVVKILPFLILLFFTKQVDEPFDHILYASICALGFAFIENTIYLERSNLYAVGGRVLYSTVGHMFDTSIIAYSMAMARYHHRPVLPAFLVGLALAALAHGFYDYWLLAPHRPFLLTLIFFLGSIHLWVVMKNNLVNLSPHYQEHMRPPSIMFRYRIINALLAIFLFTYVVKFMLLGRAEAGQLLAAQGTSMAAMMLFLAISFSAYDLIPGHIAPLLPKGGLWRLLLPKVEWNVDLSGRRLLMRIPERRSKASEYLALHHQLPLEGTLRQKIFVENEQGWYIFRPDRPIPFHKANGEVLLVKPHETNDTIPDDRYIVILVMAFAGEAAYPTARVRKEQLMPIGQVHGRLI